MPGFGDATPEQRAEWQQKRKETLARKKAEGIPNVRTDTAKRHRKRSKARDQAAPRLSKTDYRKYVRLTLIAIAGKSRLDVFEAGKFVGLEDATKNPDFAAMTEADQSQVRESQVLMQRVFDGMIASARSWCPPEDRLSDEEADMIADTVSQQSGRANQVIAPAVAQIKVALEPLLPVYRFVVSEGRTLAVVAAIAIPRIARRLPISQIRLRFGLGIIYGPIVWVAKGKASQLLARRRLTPDVGAFTPAADAERPAAASSEPPEAGSTRLDPRSEWVGEDDAAAAASGDAA